MLNDVNRSSIYSGHLAKKAHALAVVADFVGGEDEERGIVAGVGQGQATARAADGPRLRRKKRARPPDGRLGVQLGIVEIEDRQMRARVTAGQGGAAFVKSRVDVDQIGRVDVGEPFPVVKARVIVDVVGNKQRTHGQVGGSGRTQQKEVGDEALAETSGQAQDQDAGQRADVHWPVEADDVGDAVERSSLHVPSACRMGMARAGFGESSSTMPDFQR